MILQRVSKYGLATHIACAAALPAALVPFADSVMCATVSLWLSVLAAIWIVALPAVHAGESMHRARLRVVSSIIRSPLLWIIGLGIIAAAVRCFNDGVALKYNSEQSAWVIAQPFFAFLPASVPGGGLLPLAAALASWVVVAGLTHATGKAGRASFFLVSSCIAAISGFTAVGMAMASVEPFVKATAADFETPFLLGLYYAAFLAAAIAGGISAERLGWVGARPWFAIAVGGCTAGTVFFLPTFAAIVFVIPMLAYAAYGLVLLKRRASVAAVARALSLIMFGLFAVGVLLFTAPASSATMKARRAGLSEKVLIGEKIRTLTDIYNRAGMAMWQKQPWSGVGIGAYGMQLPFFVEKEDWETLPPEPVAALNGYVSVLAERGIVGCAILLAVLGFLLFSWVAGFLRAWRINKAATEADKLLLSLPVGVWAMFVVLIPFLLIALTTSVFGQPMLLPILAGTLACSAASFPHQSVSQKAS